MKYKLLISTILSLSIHPSLFASNSYTPTVSDNNDSTKTAVTLKEVSVTGRKSNSARKAISVTPVYDRDIMKTAPVQTIENALKLSPAIDVRQRGGKDVQTDILLRGGSFDQTMVMLNGVDFTDARTGHQSHSLPLDINIVSNISVVDGVAGVGSYSGAVDIHTAPIFSNYISAEATAGMHNYFYGNLNGNISTERMSILAMVSGRHSSGYTHNTDFTNYNAYANARFSLSPQQTFEAQAGYQHRAFGANGFYARKYPDQYETTSTALGSLRWRGSFDRFLLSSTVSYRRNTDCYELIKGDESAVPFNHHITDNFGAQADATYLWGAVGETSLHIDYTLNHILSTVLGDIREDKKIGGVIYNHEKSRGTLNAILRHSATIKKLTLSAAGGLSHSPYGTDALWSAGTNIALNQSFRLGASAVESMRLPSFTDLYYTATGYESDRNLVPEHATTVNISSNFSNGKFDASAYVYYRHGRNVIDWIKLSDADNWRSMQVTRINTLGAELTASYTTKTILRRTTLSYGHIYQDSKVAPGMVSSFALDYLRNKLSGSIDIVPFPHLSLSLTATLFDRCGNYIDSSGQAISYSPFCTLDARICYQRSWWQIYVDGTNLTSTRYFDYGGLQMPGCWMSGGIIITLQK